MTKSQPPSTPSSTSSQGQAPQKPPGEPVAEAAAHPQTGAAAVPQYEALWAVRHVWAWSSGPEGGWKWLPVTQCEPVGDFDLAPWVERPSEEPLP